MKKFNTDKELLSAYVDGELAQSDKNLIEEKIKSSLELQKELSDLKRLKELTSRSVDRISDSPFFETRLFANLKSESESKSKLNFKKWLPISALTLITLGLMIILKFNPNLLNNLIEEQRSNIVGFYKQNLQPLLYAADLTNEDIFNFALYQELPLDSANQQVLKLGYDTAGTEYFEIKNASDFKQVNNLQKFVAALELNDEETEMIDSIIGSYSEDISGLVLVNDKNSVAINPNIWNTRKIILADILAFAKKHAGNNYSKILPTQVAQFDDRSIANWVNEAKSVKDDQYIFCTPDSIFRDSFEFDMTEFSKNMEKITEELAELHEQKALVNEYRFRIDASFDKHKKHSDKSNQFEVFVDRDFIKVNVQSFGVDIPEIDLPDFDSIAIIINEATKNIHVVRPTAPPVTVGKKSFNYNYNTLKPRKSKNTDVNLDSLMHEKNIKVDSKRSEQKKRFENQSTESGSSYYFNDSLIILQNQDLKKEMDKLRRELEQFRNDFKVPQKDDDSLRSKKSKQNSSGDGIKDIET